MAQGPTGASDDRLYNPRLTPIDEAIGPSGQVSPADLAAAQAAMAAEGAQLGPTSAQPPPMPPTPIEQPVTLAPAPQPMTPAPMLAPPPVQPPQPAGVPMATQTEIVTQKAAKLSQQQKDAEQKAYDARLKADEAKANLETDVALAQSMEAQDTTRKLQKQQAEDAAAAKNIQTEADDAAKKWQASIDEYNKIRRDGPEQMSTGGAILAAIAQALGAFGAGLTGGPNQAMQILNKAADDRVRKWERQLSEAKGSIDTRQNAVAWFRQKGLDARSAAQAARQAVLDDAMIRGDQLTAQYKGEAIKSTWEQTKALREQERVAAVNQRALEEQDKRVVKTITGPAGGGQGSLESQIRLEGLKVDVPQKDKAGNVTGYQTYMARSPQDAEKVRQALVIRQAIGDNLARLKKHVDEKWQSVPLSTAKRQADAIADDLRTQFGVLRNLGALSDKDFAVASQVGDPTAWTQSDAKTIELADNFASRLDDMVMSEMQGRGLFR